LLVLVHCSLFAKFGINPFFLHALLTKASDLFSFSFLVIFNSQLRFLLFLGDNGLSSFSCCCFFSFHKRSYTTI